MSFDNNKIKIVAVILLVSMILNFCFVIIHLEHDCNHNDGCQICSLINKVKDDFNKFLPNFNKIIMFLLFNFIIINSYFINNIFNKKKDTLISLKVLMLN